MLPKPPILSPPPGVHAAPAARVDSGEAAKAAQAAADLQILRQHLLPQVEDARGLRWTRDFKFLGVLALGLFPLAVWTLFNGEPTTFSWCFGFYFSVLWALFFYHFFAPPGATRTDSLIAFFVTGLVSAVVLFVLFGMGLGTIRDGFLGSPNTFVRIGANFLGVALPEEICKAAILFYFLFRKPAPAVPTMVFYGLMSGFGIGIYLAMNAQSFPSYAANASTPSGTIAVPLADPTGLLQFTALPFLEAVWTAIGAWFWTLGKLAPSRRIVLWFAALAVPVLLHGLHSSFIGSVPWVSFGVDFVAVFLLLIFVCRPEPATATGNQPAPPDTRPLPSLPPSAGPA